VQRSLGYFTNTHRDAQIEYMVGVGSAFKLPGLQKYLGDKLQLRVEKPTKFQRLAGEAVTNAPVFVDNLLTFPVAYGLALQSVGAARLRTNLLPPEIAWDRKIRAKKPWAAAAAACLLIGTAVWAYGYSVPYAAVNDPKIGSSLDKNKKANEEAAGVVKQIAGENKKVEVSIKSVEAIIAGTDERLNWLRMCEFINSCVPVPGEKGNMTKANGQEKFWNTRDGEGGGSDAATKKYFERIRKGVDPKLAYMEDDMRQYLPAVDIEAVHCRYTEDLPQFFTKAKQYCKDYVGVYFDGMDDEEKKGVMADPPILPPHPVKDGNGYWVFEIRGTTWYDRGILKGPELLRETLLANLKANSKTTQDPALKGRISHVFLYNCSNWKDEDPRPDTYHFIYTSLINFLVPPAQSGTASTTGGKAGLPALPTGGLPGANPTGGGWQGLTKGDVGVAADSSAGAGGNPYQRQAIPKPTATATGTGTGMDPMPVEKKTTNKKPRYEFIIVFVWKENTPSDKFIDSGPTPK
jgi:hypothetical protein